MPNNKFLQILRNFDSTSRAQAKSKLDTVAQGNLYHAGTPVVAFYTAETKSFANRSAAKTYGTDETRTYKALLGIMGAGLGDIEIFDIETSVEAILGGANQITTSANSVFPSKTWDFTSLGGVQVVIEQMDEVLTTEIGDLKTRITNLTGQSGSAYVPTAAASQENPNGAHYINDATSLQNALDQLDSEVYGISQTVASQRLESPDGTITINTPQGSDHTNVDVHIKTGEDVLRAAANDAGLETVINITALTDAQIAALSDSDKANIRAAYKLTGIDGTTQKGDLIKIYKDSALTNVYLGTTGDSLSGEDGTSHESASSTVVPGTGSESLNFVYHLENGNYKMEKVDVETFLQESEFGNGLQVNDHVVSVKVDPLSEEVITAYGETNTTAPVLSVGANGVKADNIQAAIDAAVAHGGTSIINSTMTALSDGNVTVVNTNQGSVNHIAIKQGTDASGAKTYEFLENDIASKAALDAEVTRAQNAETAIDSAVGLTKAASGETRTYTSQVTLGASETAPTTVAGDINLLDAHVEALSDAIDGLNGSATASNVAAGTDTTPNADFTVLTKVNQVEGEIQEVGAAATDSKSVLLKKVAATGAAADVSYSNTNSQMTATNVQAAIDELKADTLEAKTVVVGEADAAHADPNTAENGVYVTETADQTDGHAIYTVAIDVFDCGTY